MARGFSEQEKENIRRSLQEACKQYWMQYGYKKTSVDELCREAGISKGAFYLFFASKEELFCEVLCSVQTEICEAALAIMEEKRSKYGVAEALKMVYREYDKSNFLYDADSRDFTILMNKLSPEQAKKLEDVNNRSRQLFVNQPYMNLKVKPELAVSVIYSLLMNIKNKHMLPCDHPSVFDFMVDSVLDHLYQ